MRERLFKVLKLLLFFINILCIEIAYTGVSYFFITKPLMNEEGKVNKVLW